MNDPAGFRILRFDWHQLIKIDSKSYRKENNPAGSKNLKYFNFQTIQSVQKNVKKKRIKKK